MTSRSTFQVQRSKFQVPGLRVCGLVGALKQGTRNIELGTRSSELGTREAV